VPDVHLISLLPEVEGFVVPSKFYGIAAAGRPTIFVGNVEGEIAQLVVESQCGIAVQTGDFDGLRAAILRLRNDVELRKTFGRNARDALEKRFDKRIALSAWNDCLNSVSRDS